MIHKITPKKLNFLTTAMNYHKSTIYIVKYEQHMQQ